MFTQKIGFWGNSLGVRLPQAVTRQVGLEEGTVVSIFVADNKIVLAPAHPKYTLDQLLKDADSTLQHDELSWGKAIGEENW